MTYGDWADSWQLPPSRCTSHPCLILSAAHLERARQGTQVHTRPYFDSDCIFLGLLLKLSCRFFVFKQRRASFFVRHPIQLLIRLFFAFDLSCNLTRCYVSTTRIGPLPKSQSRSLNTAVSAFFSPETSALFDRRYRRRQIFTATLEDSNGIPRSHIFVSRCRNTGGGTLYQHCPDAHGRGGGTFAAPPSPTKISCDASLDAPYN